MKSMYCVVTLDTDDDNELREVAFGIIEALSEIAPTTTKDVAVSLNRFTEEELDEIQEDATKLFTTNEVIIRKDVLTLVEDGTGHVTQIVDVNDLPSNTMYERNSC